MRLWLLSNGRGEDRAAALIGSELCRRRPGLDLSAAPLLSRGEAFIARGIPVAVTGSPPPSGGFPTAGVFTFIRDLPAVPAYVAYLRYLRRLATRADRFLAVGDVFLTGLGRISLHTPGIHVALAKSVYGRRHSRLEHRLLRRWTRMVFARDEATAAALGRGGVRAAYAGNPLVDALSPSASPDLAPWPDADQSVAPTARVLLLPGSRAEAPANLARLLEVACAVAEPSSWACAWPDNIPIDVAVDAALSAGWTAAGGEIARGNRVVALVERQFEDLLAGADLVIGLAGSANEQAAAVGKPLVTMVGCGPQATASRMIEQERLLGGAARFVRGGAGEVAAVVTRLLRAPAERREMGCLGAARLGPPGGAGRIAERVIDELGL